jgi:tetratricopeptide (TPR) repeat protein
LKLEPGYAAGWLFFGDSPYGLKQWEAALTAYRKALELDPSIAQAHRFAADALAQLGRLDEAETEYIRAVAWDPAYKEAWEALENLGRQVGFRVEQHPFSPPAKMLGHSDKGVVEIGMLKDDKKDESASPWLAYATCKAAWRFEPGFRSKRLNLVKDEPWLWSSTEEQECAESYMEASYSAVENDREKRHEKALEGADLIAALPDDIRFLTDVMKAHMLETYVIFEGVGRRCPAPFALLPREVIDAIEAYIRKFVVIHTGPARGDKNGG